MDSGKTKGGVRTAAVRRASDIVGRSRLREILGVSAMALTFWLSGAEVPPTDVFLKAVDLIADSELRDLRGGKAKR